MALPRRDRLGIAWDDSRRDCRVQRIGLIGGQFLRRWILGWTALAIVGWFLVAASWSSNEAKCDTSTSLICISTKGVWLLTTLYAAIVWLVGLSVIAIGWLVSHGFRKDKQ